MADVLVVLPTYNERSNLAGILGRLRAALPDADVLVVDDDSPDGTGELADDLARGDAGVRVLHRPGKQGLGRAYLEGFRLGLGEGYRYLVEIDADGSHDPAELPAMLATARSGADLVLGSRWVEGGAILNWPRSRQAISRAGNRYSRLLLRSDIGDLTSGFRVYRAELLQALDLGRIASQGYCFQVEMAWRAEREGFTVVEHPITFVERVEGRSKMHAGIVAEALLRVAGWGLLLRLGFRRPASGRGGAPADR